MAEILEFKRSFRHQTLQSYRHPKTLIGFIRANEVGAQIRGYMSGFPQFARMARVLARHVGFDLCVDGRSLLGSALEEAVLSGEQLAENKMVENMEVSDTLVLTLVKAVASLYDWKVAFETEEGLNVWDTTAMSFGTWMKGSKHQEFMVIKHQVDVSEFEKLGLAVRLLCFGGEDEMIGRIVSKI